MKALGISRHSSELEALCKTSATEGTSPKNMIRALDKLEGIIPVVLSESREDVAMLRIRFAVRNQGPAVCVVDNGEHYVTVIGFLGERFLVCDSADSELVVSYSPQEWANRWRESDVKKPFWAVVLANG